MRTAASQQRSENTRAWPNTRASRSTTAGASPPAPLASGRGQAGMVVTAAAREGLSRRPVVQYRAWRRNTAPIAVAVRCEFIHYRDGLVIHLVP